MVSRRGAAAIVCGLVAGAALVYVWNRPQAPAIPATPRLGTPGAPTTSREDLRRTLEAMEARVRATPADRAVAVTFAEALWRQARVTGDAGLAARAEHALRTALEQEPTDYDARRMLATVLAFQHRFREAMLEARRAADLRPRDPWIQGVIADAHFELGDYDEAFAAVDRMMELRPDAAAYARASYAREIQGDLPAATRLMQMAAEATSPHDPESLAWLCAQLGELHIQSGNLTEARRRFKQADSVFPDTPRPAWVSSKSPTRLVTGTARWPSAWRCFSRRRRRISPRSLATPRAPSDATRTPIATTPMRKECGGTTRRTPPPWRDSSPSAAVTSMRQ